MNQTLPQRRRCRPLRHERDDVALFVTNRTIEERFWLHPLVANGATPCNRQGRRAMKAMDRLCDRWYEGKARQANAAGGKYAPKWTGQHLRRLATGLVGATIARAQKKCGVEIIAVVVMSNHIHLVIRTPRKNCSEFMRVLKSNLARAVNRMSGRRGPLWARRADIQPALDEEASIERAVYCVDNPRKANLVSKAELWPGLLLCYGLGDADEIEFEDFCTTAWRKAGRPVDLAPYFRKNMLRLSPVPGIDSEEREAFATVVRTRLAQHAVPEQTQVSVKGAPLGILRILQTSINDRPKQPAFSKRPYCFGSALRKREYFQQMSLIVQAHEGASVAYLAGHRTAAFPEGTYPPPITQAA